MASRKKPKPMEVWACVDRDGCYLIHHPEGWPTAQPKLSKCAVGHRLVRVRIVPIPPRKRARRRK